MAYYWEVQPPTRWARVKKWLEAIGNVLLTLLVCGAIFSGCSCYVSYDQSVFFKMYPGTTSGDYWWHALKGGGSK
jgi:uncharacterized protein YceK